MLDNGDAAAVADEVGLVGADRITIYSWVEHQQHETDGGVHGERPRAHPVRFSALW